MRFFRAKRSFSRKDLLTISTLMLSSSCAFNVLAQASGSSNDLSLLEEVVVTAQFREQNVQDTPIAITAISADMMNARSQTNISELANQAPSVTMKQQGSAFGPSMGASIRGVGQYDFNPALEPGVGLYVDDVYYPTLTGSMFDLLDLERVEILRGPQGTLAGKNSIGGAIKMFSKKPAGEGGGFMSALIGQDRRAEFRGSTDFAVSEKVAARISGVFKSQDGYVDRIDYGCKFPNSAVVPIGTLSGSGDCTLSKMGGQGYHAFRTLVNYEASSSLNFLFAADYTKENHTAAGEVPVYADKSSVPVTILGVPYDANQYCGEYCNYTRYSAPADPRFGLEATVGSDQIDHEAWSASLVTDWQLNEDFALKSISAYREYETQWSQANGASAAIINVGKNALDHWFLSQELRLSGNLSESLFLTVGAFYSNQQTVYFTLQDLRYIEIPGFLVGSPDPLAPSPLQFLGDDPVDADTAAVFANLNWDITEDLSVNLGLRYTEETKDYTFFRYDIQGNVHPRLGGLNGKVGSYADELTDYRVAVNYRLNEDLMVYASTSTGFKGGGVNPRPFSPPQVLTFNSEQVTAYELGVKGDFFDNHMRMNAAMYFNDYEDIQLTLLNCGGIMANDGSGLTLGELGAAAPCALPQNVADAEVKGVEVEAMIYPTRGMTIDLSVSVLDFSYKDAADVSLIGVLNDASPYTPEKKASIGIQYEFGLSNGSTLTPRLDTSYQSSLHTNATVSAIAPGVSDIDSYTLSNFRLTWRSASEDLEAALEVTNLFDKYYFLSKFDLTGAGGGMITGLPARPREVAFSVRKNF